MYDYESIRQTIVDQARNYYAMWKRCSEDRDMMRAMENMHKYQAVSALAMDLFDIKEDELTGKATGPLENYAQKEPVQNFL